MATVGRGISSEVQMGHPLQQENAVARAWRPKKYLRQDHAKECQQHRGSADQPVAIGG